MSKLFGVFKVGDMVQIKNIPEITYEVRGYLSDCGVYQLHTDQFKVVSDLHMREELVVKAGEEK